MKTSSWMTYRGPGRVGISIGTPRGAPAGYRLFKALAPTRPMLKMNEADYGALYAQILAELDPQATWDRLHELAAGEEPVLLCFEKPPFTADHRCHRRRVSKWFEDTLGHKVPELGYDGPDFV